MQQYWIFKVLYSQVSHQHRARQPCICLYYNKDRIVLVNRKWNSIDYNATHSIQGIFFNEMPRHTWDLCHLSASHIWKDMHRIQVLFLLDCDKCQSKIKANVHQFQWKQRCQFICSKACLQLRFIACKQVVSQSGLDWWMKPTEYRQKWLLFSIF